MRARIKRVKTGFCQKCGELKIITTHHILPKRFFGANEATLRICRDCHDEIEEILPRNRELTKAEYFEIHKAWLKDKCITIIEEEKEVINGKV